MLLSRSKRTSSSVYGLSEIEMSCRGVAAPDREQVLHVANHVLSTLTWQGERGLLAALQKNDPSLFDGGEAALLRCVHELVWCMRISDNNALTRLICR